MSGGRVELGIGAGWCDAEHQAYAIPFPSLGERFDRLTEQLHIITGLWTTPVGEKFDYAGTHYTVAESPALPKAVHLGPRRRAAGVRRWRSAGRRGSRISPRPVKFAVER
jgi:alkanesulfonate monooxygenase SsuD/methylene tetrahydromethanopterin reductase-like flavin-dependent oxidoreductase (luciferase family)